MKAAINWIGDWLYDRTWFMQSIMGTIWIFMAIICLGKGETYGIFVTFFGMLVWASLEKDNQLLQRQNERALKGWLRTLDEWRDRMQCWRCRGEGFLVIPWGMRPVVCDTCGGVGSLPEVDVEPDNPLIEGKVCP